MPYQGDRHPDRPQGRFTTDFSYLRKLPGALILVQLVCASLGFTLAAAGSAVWRVRRGHAFFTFVSFMSVLSCVCWVMTRVFQLDALFKREVNWNVVGLVHNGLNAFFLMLASCLMVEAASSARTLRAAGVFGFLGFSAFLSGLVWEAIVWRSNRDSGPGFSTATVVSGLERSRTPDSEQSGGIAATEGPGEEEVSFVGMKARPVSSFMEQSGHITGVSTPMLVVPRAEEEDTHSSQRSSSAASSVQGEWQMPSSGPA